MSSFVTIRSDPVRWKSAFPLVEIDITILNINFNQWNVFFCSNPNGSGEMEISLNLPHRIRPDWNKRRHYIGWNWRPVRWKLAVKADFYLTGSDRIGTKQTFHWLKLTWMVIYVNFNQWNVFFYSNLVGSGGGNQPWEITWLKMSLENQKKTFHWMKITTRITWRHFHPTKCLILVFQRNLSPSGNQP